jgi:hypothetical protein
MTSSIPSIENLIRHFAALFTDQGTNDYVETSETRWLRPAITKVVESTLITHNKALVESVRELKQKGIVQIAERQLQAPHGTDILYEREMKGYAAALDQVIAEINKTI